MSKKGYISRYLLILRKLRQKPYSSYEEIRDHIDNQLEFLRMQDDSIDIGLSKRTLQRDLKDIRNLFGIDIEYSKANKGYCIVQDATENMNFQRMIEAFDLFNSLNISQDVKQFISLEQRKPQGTENLYGLLHAIKNNRVIQFNYQKYWIDELTERTVEPYALKEFKNRWYVMAKGKNDEQVKSFALDRISKLEITAKKFDYPTDYNIEESYRYCFGIINPENEEAQKVVLSFQPTQGKFIKSLPLHHTQKILIDNEKEVRIQLQVYLTHEFVMELLSFGSEMKAIQPKALVDQLKAKHKKAYEQY